MKLSAITALFASIVAVNAIDISLLEDGAYSGELQKDGSVLVRRLAEPDAAPIALPASPEVKPRQSLDARNVHSVQKRYTSCWGNALDHSGTDAATNGLRNWSNVPGGRTLTSGDRPNWIGFVSEGMMAYYCINAPNKSGNLDLNDVNYALSQMDAACPRYTASYFQWNGSPEIVGKVASGVNICRG